MADIKSPTERYKAIADAIREKNGTTELMQPADMPQMILELSGGAEYTDITYNEDNTITLTDKDGVVHTMECEYSEDGKVIGVTYDGKKVDLTYDGDVLVKVGKTVIVGETFADKIYNFYGIDKSTYPYVYVIVGGYGSRGVDLCFAQEYKIHSNGYVYVPYPMGSDPTQIPPNPNLFANKNNTNGATVFYGNVTNLNDVFEYVTTNITKDDLIVSNWEGFDGTSDEGVYANFDLTGMKFDEECTILDLRETVPNKPHQNGFAIGLASGGVVEVIDTTEIDNLEDLIDNSGVLEDTEGSVEDKVEELIENTYIFKNIQDMSFQKSEIESVDIYISHPLLSHYDFFRNAKKLKYVKGVNTSKSTDIRNFINGSTVEIIEMPLDISSVINPTYTQNAFATTTLKEIRFVEECIKVSLGFVFCSLLSAESKQSIFDGLAIVETAQTVTFHADAKILQSQVDSANAKGWTVAGGTVVSEEEYYA